jgi:hypothetical protein
MISATVRRPISGAVPEMWISPSLDGLLGEGVFAFECANLGENVTSIVARSLKASMKSFFSSSVVSALAGASRRTRTAANRAAARAARTVKDRRWIMAVLLAPRDMSQNRGRCCAGA